MTTFTAEQKSQLAKLMATENLTVQHQKIRTAKFDPVNRVLYLPIWQDMSGDLYDLLCGHEVGHALYTPASGWHDAVLDKTKHKNFKSFLNVVEDARIEKKVKRRYPGLNKSFRNAYQELMNRDFFGIKGRDINGMAFIERLNIYTKSQYSATYIKFSQEEQKLINKVQALETWEDVMRVTDEIFAYSKDEQFEMMEMQDFQSFGQSDDGDYDDEYDFDSEMDETNSNQEPEKITDKPQNKKKSNENSEDTEESEEDEEGSGKPQDKQDEEPKDDLEPEDTSDENGTKLNRFKNSTESYEDQFAPKCETDDNYRANEDLLLDAKCKEYVYVDVPTVVPKNVYTPAKRVQELISEYYDGLVNDAAYFSVTESYVKNLVNEFKRKNERYVSLLAKEFEMKKAAKAFAKNKVSDSGDIDIGRLAGYKFDDNIFRKVMHIPKGKSHGLVLLLDYSGSMSDNMAGSIEQILVLSMFCRKVNIPFVVYSFTDNMDVHYIDRTIDRFTAREKDFSSFENNIGEISLSNVHLREYMNSKMSNAEYNKCLRNMVLLKESYSQGRFSKLGRPDSESMSNTPLIQAVFAIAPVMQEFKKVNNLDITSLIIVHDGDADYTHSVNCMGEGYDRMGQKVPTKTSKFFDQRYQNVFLRDRKIKFEQQLSEVRNSASDPLLQATLNWFKQATKSKVFGFFILASRHGYAKAAIYNRFTNDEGKTLRDLEENGERWVAQEKCKDLVKVLKQTKFLVSKTKGYNEFYLISGGSDLQTDDEEFEFEGKVTSNKLKNAFMKFNKQKQVNRVLVSRFIQGIAA